MEQKSITEEKMTLTDHFLADGIDEVAFVFEFLPDCVANVAGQQFFLQRFKAPSSKMS